VRRHFLRVLERATVRKVSGDPGRAEGVAADFRRDAGRRRATADHAPGIPAGSWACRIRNCRYARVRCGTASPCGP
jgi:hypothetical protein